MLLQTEFIPDGTWHLILGPTGLLVASVIVVVILWRKLNAERVANAKAVAELHKARHDDLVSGLKYREGVGAALLQDKIEERVTANKLIDAVQGLATQQEKTDASIQVVRESVQEIKTVVSRRT